MDSAQQLVSHAHRRSLAQGLRTAFEDVEVRLGELLVAEVEGEVDAMGGAIATVEDAGSSWQVRLMPALRDDGMLLVACECTTAEDPVCAHVWAVLRVIDAREIWPPDVALPSDIAVTDPNDPDLELISEGSGVAITGVKRVPALTAGAGRQSVTSEAARMPEVPRSWRELVYSWPRAAAPAAGKLARIEYVLQATPTAALDAASATDRTLDDRACAVLVATVGGGRKYRHIDASRLAPEDLAIRTLLFGVDELVNLGTRGGRPVLQPNAGKQIAARINASRAAGIFEQLAATRRFGWLPDPNGPIVPLSWDGGGVWELEISIAPGKRGRASVSGALRRGDARVELDTIVAVAGAGIAISGDRAIPVAVDGLGRWLSLLARGLTLARAEVAAFIDRTCTTRRRRSSSSAR